MRHILGIEKIRKDGDTHHAVDAIIIACATQSMCQLISSLNATQKNEDVKQQQDEILSKIVKELNIEIPENIKNSLNRKEQHSTARFSMFINLEQ